MLVYSSKIRSDQPPPPPLIYGKRKIDLHMVDYQKCADKIN